MAKSKAKFGTPEHSVALQELSQIDKLTFEIFMAIEYRNEWPPLWLETARLARNRAFQLIRTTGWTHYHSHIIPTLTRLMKMW